MKLTHLALLACLTPLAQPAFADTIFNLSGRLETDKLHDGGGDYDHDAVLSGTLTLNSAGTAFDAVHLTYNFAYGKSTSATYPITFNTVASTIAEGNGFTRVRLLGTSSVFYFAQNIDIPTGDLSTYQGGNLCGTDYGFDCSNALQSLGNIYYNTAGQYGYSNIESGTLSLANPKPVPPVPAGVTPEPTSIMLLGTGLLGTAGVLRRRIVT